MGVQEESDQTTTLFFIFFYSRDFMLFHAVVWWWWIRLFSENIVRGFRFGFGEKRKRLIFQPT